MYGTQAAVAHVNTSGVIAGLVTDFPQFQPSVNTFVTSPELYQGVSGPR